VNGPFALVIALTIVIGLVIHARLGFSGEVAVSVWVGLLVAVLFRRGSSADRRAFAACLGLAVAGEWFLSAFWGVYEYRDGRIPFYVPPGHVLLYVLGLWGARVMPERFSRRIHVGILVATALLGLSHLDEFSVLLLLFFLGVDRAVIARPPYPVLFALAFGLEVLGTRLGIWAWRNPVPAFGLVTLNPPFAAGSFYCVLAWLVSFARPEPRRSVVEIVPAG